MRTIVNVCDASRGEDGEDSALTCGALAKESCLACGADLCGVHLLPVAVVGFTIGVLCRPCLGRVHKLGATALAAWLARLAENFAVDIRAALAEQQLRKGAAASTVDPVTAAEEAPCQHGVIFDHVRARTMTPDIVRVTFPRLDGTCPLGCGYAGIYYVSVEHYLAGDW